MTRSALAFIVLASACSSTPPPEPPATSDDERLPQPEEGWTLLGEREKNEPAHRAPNAWRSAPPPDQPVAPPSDHGRCIRSRMCELEGYCSLDQDIGQCIAASDDDCRPSDACLGGRCTASEGHCIAASDEDCRDSWACKGYGLCSHDGEAACVATAADDCRASTRCARLGECSLQAGACVSP